MHGVDRLHAMEVIVVCQSDVGVIESTAHHSLGVLIGPGVAMAACGQVRVFGLVAVAGRFERVGSLHLDTLKETLKNGLRVVLDFTREVLGNHLVDELNDGSTEALPCSFIVHIWHQISLLHGLGRITGQIAHMGGSLKGIDWEHVGLARLDVDLGVPVGFCQTRDAHQTVLCSTKSQGWHFVVEVSCAIVVDLVVGAEEHGAHKDLALDSVGVLVSIVLSHDTAERVASDNDVITSETSLCKLLESLGHVVINEDRFWGIQ